MTSRTSVPVIDCRTFGADMMTCRFARPDRFAFRPGQYFLLTLDTEEGEQTKPFSLAAAPDDPYIEMTTRDSGSSFKRALRALAPGDSVTVAGPAGRLLLPADHGPLAFLIGGVGITPVRSMIRDAIHQGNPLAGVLVYGNRDESCIAYHEELDDAVSSALRVVHVLEHPPEGWEGETGFINAVLARRHLEPDADYLYVIAGPPPMVAAMERVMDELGVQPTRRMVERFTPSPT